MKKWIGAALVALALNFGGSAAIEPAAAAPLAKQSQASKATDFSARRYYRRYYRHGYRPYYRPYYRAHYRPYYRSYYRPYYYGRPAYYRPYPYYYRPYPYYAPAFPIGFGIGFGFGPRWGW